MTSRSASFAPRSFDSAPSTPAGPWLGAPEPPRRITWPSGLPVVCRIAGVPLWSTPAKECVAAAARTASTATWTLPSVRFLKPTGIDRPEPSWRWIWLSVVRAPIAAHETVSEMYCGVIGSRNSQPTGRPRRRTSSSSSRAARTPASTSPEPSRCGSLMRPFQPVVVRGFSKYTRIAMSRSCSWRSASARSRRAYSRAASGSCTLHGPTTTSSRSSIPSRIASTSARPRRTRSAISGSSGRCSSRSAGVVSGDTRAMRVSRTAPGSTTLPGRGMSFISITVSLGPFED